MNDELMNKLMDLGEDGNDVNSSLGSMLPTMIPGLFSSRLGDPKMIQEVIQNTVNQYRPVVYTLLSELFSFYDDLANNDELFKTQALIKYNAYKAYIDIGFTKEQATLFLLDSDITRKKLLNQIATARTKVSTS